VRAPNRAEEVANGGDSRHPFRFFMGKFFRLDTSFLPNKKRGAFALPFTFFI
jgi:hypothetical protein